MKEQFQHNEIETEGELQKEQSKPQPISLYQKICAKLCPCLCVIHFQQDENRHQVTTNELIDKQQNLVSKNHLNFKDNSLVTGTLDSQDMRKDSKYYSNVRQKQEPCLTKSLNNYGKNGKQQQQEFQMTYTSLQKRHSYPIYQLENGKIIAIGGLLALVDNKNILPSEISLRKMSLARNKDIGSDINKSTAKIDEFWEQRYLIFQKFDEGFCLLQEDWKMIIPEAIAEYISFQIHCQNVLDAFCGIGGMSIKLANTCQRVIAIDRNIKNLKCLNTNMKLFCSNENVEMMKQNFLEINQNLEPDIVFLHCPLKKQVSVSNKKNIFSEDFEFGLDKIITKTIKICKNFILLLPPNIEIKQLGFIISDALKKSSEKFETCSIKIQKLFFLKKLMYIIVYFGPQVQHSIKINDQLSFIYQMLKNERKGAFKHRKLVKKIRQQYGMAKLFHFVKQSIQIYGNNQNKSALDNFLEYVKKNKILKQQKIRQILEDQKKQAEYYQSKKITLATKLRDQGKQIMQQEKYTGEKQQDEQSEQKTISYYSMGSGVHRVSIALRQSHQCEDNADDGIKIISKQQTKVIDNKKKQESYNIMEQELIKRTDSLVENIVYQNGQKSNRQKIIFMFEHSRPINKK